MTKTDPRIDAYIERSASFAQPILIHFRTLIHTVCPEAEETIKWGFPNFIYAGSILCNMASFKQHCSLGFWKASLMKDTEKLLTPMGETAMGQFGRIISIADLPSDNILSEYIKEAMRLNTDRVKIPARQKTTTTARELEVPAYFMDRLNKSEKALTTFEAFSQSNKKEYVAWVAEAKTEATRMSRLETAVEWMEEGKVRMWKYIIK